MKLELVLSELVRNVPDKEFGGLDDLSTLFGVIGLVAPDNLSLDLVGPFFEDGLPSFGIFAENDGASLGLVGNPVDDQVNFSNLPELIEVGLDSFGRGLLAEASNE